MSYTKRDFIDSAFEELGMSSEVYNIQDFQYQTALKRLDSMMALWNSKGIRLSYPLPGSPSTSNLDSITNVPDKANEAIYKNLAIKIAPAFGKVVPPEVKADASMAYKDLMASNVNLEEMQPNSMPKGAGAKTYGRTRSRFITPKERGLDVGSDGAFDFY